MLQPISIRPIQTVVQPLHPRWNASGSQTIFGTDRFGFGALPGGLRWGGGEFYGFKQEFHCRFLNVDAYARMQYNWEYLIYDSTAPVVATSIRPVRTATPAEQLLPDGPISAVYPDIDGNNYPCTKIGLQVWTRTNLKVTKYADGTPIPTNLSNAAWVADTTGACAVYGKADGAFVPVDELTTEALMVEAYGRLYNWYAVTNVKGLITPGAELWHVPSDAEFTQMTNYLIATYPDITSANIGDVLKSTRQIVQFLDNYKLDVKESTTIELNMGGISLLDLASRPATYTNSFSLPATQNNEDIMQFASKPSRNNRPELPVMIEKGLFQRKASLKVLDYDNEYKCSVSYDDAKLIDIFKENIFESVYTFGFDRQILIKEGLNSIQECVDYVNTGITIGQPLYRNLKCGYTNLQGQGVFIDTTSIFNLISAKYGITFSGTLFSDPNFLSGMFLMKDTNFVFFYDSGTLLWKIYIDVIDNTLISDIIKNITLAFASDIRINGNTITMDVLSLSSVTPMLMEGFEFKKLMTSGLSKNNYIVYNTAAMHGKYFGADIIIGDGIGDKELLKLNIYIPNTDGNGHYLVAEADARNTIVMLKQATTSISRTFYVTTNDVSGNVTSNAFDAVVLSLNGLFSTILNPIFANPVILEASKWLDPFTANQVSQTRVISSVQLAGKYWVDSMANDLQSGNTKMKLIKLP